jgi:pimeloyl-ACP methyl ester carboxylesterase
MPENASSLEAIGQEFADYSKDKAYIVDTTTEKVAEGSLTQEAKALALFIQSRGIKNITLVGNSQGGAEAIHLVSLLQAQQPDVKIEGLALFDPVTIYEQPRRKLLTNYIKDILKTGVALTHTPDVKKGSQLHLQNAKYTKDGIVGILKAVIHSRGIGMPLKIWNEISEMSQENPDLVKVTTPVIVYQGAHDRVSNPSETIPSSDQDSSKGYAEDSSERERLLRNIFPNSPYVKIVVPEKMGYHNVSYSRPESFARSSLYLLKRYYRGEAKKAPAV